MKSIELPLPELGAAVVTRVLLGVGIGLLAGGAMAASRRKAIGMPLLLVGIGSTIPLAIDVVRRAVGSSSAGDPESAPAGVADGEITPLGSAA